MELDALHKEVKYRTARSSGSGGQHVNKVETKVLLYFDVENSIALNREEKSRVIEKLATRINKEGKIIVVSQEKRTQLLNKSHAWKRFLRLLEKALEPEKKAKLSTHPSQ